MIPKIVTISVDVAEYSQHNIGYLQHHQSTMTMATGATETPSEAVLTAAAAASKKRGPSYTKTEDLLVCKSFIRASEDSIIGTSQKGREFKKKQHIEYVKLTAEQLRIDQALYDRGNDEFRQAVGAPTVYHQRTPDSVYSRFKDTIAYRCLKFIGVQETTPQPSGSNENDYFDVCNTIYQRRYPLLGNFNDYKQCLDYLKDMPKFRTYKMMVEEADDQSKKKRPVSRDKAKQQAADVQVVKKAIAEVKDVASKPTASISTDVVGIIKDIGTTFLSQMSEESDAKFAALLDEDDRKTWTKELFKTKMLQKRIKRRRLEAKLKHHLTQDSSPSTATSSVTVSDSLTLSSDSETEDLYN